MLGASRCEDIGEGQRVHPSRTAGGDGPKVHPDAESMMFHMQVVLKHITEAYADSLEETTSMAVYGPPNDDVLTMMTQLASPGVAVSAKPCHLAGFTRSAAE